MGDRSYCWLQLKEPASLELIELLEEELGTPNESDPRGFAYEEVNYAQLPQPVYEYLVDNQVAAGWFNGAGAEYGPGVLLFPEETNWNTFDGDITVSVKVTPEQLAYARAAQAFIEDLRT